MSACYICPGPWTTPPRTVHGGINRLPSPQWNGLGSNVAHSHSLCGILLSTASHFSPQPNDFLAAVPSETRSTCRAPAALYDQNAHCPSALSVRRFYASSFSNHLFACTMLKFLLMAPRHRIGSSYLHIFFSRLCNLMLDLKGPDTMQLWRWGGGPPCAFITLPSHPPRLRSLSRAQSATGFAV
jgi:hypothetical protein